jgi:FAD/FMN-containing dehydrogenase
MSESLGSWGRVSWPVQRVIALDADTRTLPACDGATMLPRGNGRSYGDSNLNPGGVLLDARPLNRVHAFDADAGTLDCGAGLLLADLLALVVPRGWFLPVTPGTQYVTVGGAIANDVHGKNHHVAGTFGDHVLAFELLRSDGSVRTCSPQENAPWFAATVGGLGLTGVVTRATLRLRRIPGPWIDAQTLRFRSLDEFFALSAESQRHEYAAAWIDCAAGGAKRARGVFERGGHAAHGAPAPRERTPLRVPFTPPVSLVNRATLKAFNAAYFHRHAEHARAFRPYRAFLYPLDGILEWNRLYGPRGFYQYQCVVPRDAAPHALGALLDAIATSGLGSMLAVLKQFGDAPARGLLSFPMAGSTLALDFPNRGARLHALFAELDAIVRDAGGRLYPAKDGRMDGAMFRAGYPRWREFVHFVDPCFSSGFWRRVNSPGAGPLPSPG